MTICFSVKISCMLQGLPTTRSGKMMVSWRSVRRHLGWLFPRHFQIFRGVGPPNLGGALLPLLLQCGMCGLWAVSVLHWGSGGLGGGAQGGTCLGEIFASQVRKSFEKRQIWIRKGKESAISNGRWRVVCVNSNHPPHLAARRRRKSFLPPASSLPSHKSPRQHARTHPTPASPPSPPPQEPS